MFRHGSTCDMAVRGRPQCAVRQCTARNARCAAPHRLSRNAAVAVRAQATAQSTPTEAPAAAVPAAPTDAAPEVVAPVQQPYMQYQQQGMGQRPEYYVAQPPALPMYPTPPVYAKQETSSPIPWWVWMAAGILVANVARMVQDFMKKGPQQFMAEMAMKQMMKGMTPPGGAPGASPFGGPGGANPFAAAGGANPFAAAGGASPFGAYGSANPFAPNFQPPTAPVDTTATPVGATPAAAAAAAAAAPTSSSPDGSRGEKFASRKGPSSGATTTTATKEATASNGTAAAAAGAASVAAGAAAAAPAMDVVEPEVKEPQGKKAASFFQDAAGDASSSGSGGEAEAGQMASMMESMLRDPNLQKMLYPYLPEPMRNPDSIEWMLNTPEVRKQMESMFASNNMNMNPQMLDMMKQMDFSQEKVQEQFNQLGLKPEDVMSKVMSTPDLAAGFANPKVQQAIFDISQNPMNITKYQNDPEVMNVLNKVTEVFSPAGGMGGPSQ